MYLHANAKLGLAGRYALVSAIASGMTLKAAAAAFNVSSATIIGVAIENHLRPNSSSTH